jgi:hypothetical protein
MNDERGFETLLRDALDRAGSPAPFGVDVEDRVMARIGAMGPVRRAEFGVRQFVLWAAAASVAGAALLAGTLGRAPAATDIASTVGQAVSGSTGTAMKLYAPAAALAGSLGRAGMALVASAQTVLRPLTPFQPLAHVMLVAIAAAMLGITIFVVGRDVVRNAAQRELS